MRPIRLSLCAFGPYAAEHTFDFRELGSRSFFLIHGPTGSGKTTVLDAMCFALYGDTSGNERQARQMRSDMADPSERTEVVFDFSLGTELYRVSRSPEQERPKQRGEGMTTERPKATLWQRTGLVDDNGEGHVLAAKWGDVTEAVESLLGFKSDQFRQVVLLPQGQFRRLLLATSTEREAILERLFQTEFYRIVTERLKEAARDVQEHMKDARSRGESIRSQAGVESKDELAARRAERAAQIEALALRIEELRAADVTLPRGFGNAVRPATNCGFSNPAAMKWIKSSSVSSAPARRVCSSTPKPTATLFSATQPKRTAPPKPPKALTTRRSPRSKQRSPLLKGSRLAIQSERKQNGNAPGWSPSKGK